MTLGQGCKSSLCQIRSVGGIEKQYVRLQRNRQLLQRLRQWGSHDCPPPHHVTATNIRLQDRQGTAVVLNKVDSSSTVAERLKAHTPGASEKVYEDSILDQPTQHIKQGLPH